MKHLQVDKDSEYIKNLSKNIYIQDHPYRPNGSKASALDFASLERKKELELPADRPKPTFEEKKTLRDSMFVILEESAIEETRLVSG
jgi:hypothetical protein